MGETGPCGRCSEIHYFRGNQIPCSEPTCLGPACSCDRFVEIWNNVFMEFDRQADGSLSPLPAPSIDTGMGLERISAILQGTLSNYDTDLFTPLLSALGDMSRRTYGGTTKGGDVSMRVIADHARATTFLIADGVVPSNEWRGYVLRKIMRRAMRHGNKLGLTEPFLFRLVDVLVGQMGRAYPELPHGHEYVAKVVRSEEERFEAVLAAGLPRLEDLVEAQLRSGSRTLPGEDAFKLYDSFGLPADFIEDVAGQRGLTLDRKSFDRALEAQRARARSRSAFGSTASIEAFAVSPDGSEALREAGDHFDGYSGTTLRGAAIIALIDRDGHDVERLVEGDTGYVALSATPFYVEAGGQVSDTGRLFIEGGSAEALVDGVTRGESGWPRLHRVRITKGALHVRNLVTAEADADLRDATRRNHTATHLLHAALRQVLGAHVKQAGSLVDSNRLRFDFVHFAPLTGDQVQEVERLVCGEILRNTVVQTEVRSTREAIAAGAMALFGEKYGDKVRVVSVPGFSVELCGGTHCRATGDIGAFLIVEEGGIAAGVRRIEALTGTNALRFVQSERDVLRSILASLNLPASQAIEGIEKLHGEIRRLGREVASLKMKAAMGGGQDGQEEIHQVRDVRVLTRKVEDLDKAALRDISDTLKAKLGRGVVILGARGQGTVSVVVSVTPDLTGRVHAGKLVKEIAPIVGGGGGGRPDFAEAGGKHPEKLDEMLAFSRQVVERMLAD